MTSEWETSPLGDVLAVIKNGVNCKQKKSGSGDRISRIESISDATFNLEKVGFAELSERDKEKNRLQPGDILFSHINSAVHVGKTAVFDSEEPVYHGVNLLLMRPKETVTSAYLNHALKYLFQSGYWRCVCKQSVNQASVNQQDISRVEIRYPKSLFEQQRIVGILDEAFESIATAKANDEKNLQNARALFESHLQCVFTRRGEGWKQKTLEEIATTFGRGKSKHRPRNEPRLYGGKYPFIQTGDIRNADHFITEYSQTYSKAGLAQSKLWPKGTICITIAANIAETAILSFDACFPDSVIGVVANPKEAEVGFIEYLLQSFKARIQALGKGSAQANINMGTFENERFPFPPVVEQKQIVAKLDALSEETQRLETIYQQKLATLEALKKSLLHQAFTGEL
ncbi:MAG TPA: restriction endonuclease subunit S [Nitrospiraceae bacterium]|nr:restriction endonuclease subunit S [Nitrospiraceae bacterium]